LGLGLAISKFIVEAHGGKISVESVGKDQGTTFLVEFPAARARSEAPLGHAAAAPRSRRPGVGLRILVVEDHTDTRTVLASVLSESGHVVFPAGDVAAAMKLAEREKIDVVVSDIGLPDGNGLQLMRELRDRYQLPGIALSGYGTPADLQASLEAGFSHHLIKPIDLPALEALLEKVPSKPTP
jgi:CheY-like chemotaxis protein